MRTGIGNVHDRGASERFLVVQAMACVHTLIEHACGVATIHKLHSGSTAHGLEAEDIRMGIIYEMISPEGIGEQLMLLLAPIMEGAACADDAVLQSVDDAIKAQLSRNAAYASSMLASGRFEEYKHTLADVAVCNCDLDSVAAGMSVERALQAHASTRDDAQNSTMDTESDEDEDEAERESDGDGGAPCQCAVCRQWPGLADRFAQWNPPPGLASVCASAVDLIGQQ